MTPRSLNELAALRLKEGVRQARLDLDQRGQVPPETWVELDARIDDLIDTLPEEPLTMRHPRRIADLARVLS
jgi:hypothetical protein